MAGVFYVPQALQGVLFTGNSARYPQTIVSDIRILADGQYSATEPNSDGTYAFAGRGHRVGDSTVDWLEYQEVW